VRRAGSISVHVISGEELEGNRISKKTVRTAPQALDPWPYILSVVAVAVSLGIAETVEPFFGLENVVLVFMTGIVAIAARFGLWPSILASVVASLCYNFFFLPPIYTFTIADPNNALAFFFFIVMAIIVSNVAARVREQAVTAMARARTTEALYAFSRKLAGVATLDDVLWATAYQIAMMLKVRVVLLLPEGETIAVAAGYPPEDVLDQADLAAAKWAWMNNRAAGRGSDTLPGAKRLFLPMRTGRGPVGVLGIDSDKAGPLLTPDERRLLDALSDQSALAIERVHLVEDMDRVKRTVETEHLRSALLTSISHDLKTPLAAILGSAGALRSMSGQLTDAQKEELVSTIVDESERLNRFIANLLDMTKLESGAIAPNSSLHSIGEVIGGALRRAEKILSRHKVALDIYRDLPLVKIDEVLFEQAIFNLLDNAAKYSARGSTIQINGRRDGDSVVLDIVDEGVGIPASDVERIFDKFYRVQKGDQVRPGTGLGLAIARGFIGAMQGTITASNRTDRSGAVLTIRLPVTADAAKLDTAA